MTRSRPRARRRRSQNSPDCLRREMTADAALKEIARQERRFEKIGFKNGERLINREHIAQLRLEEKVKRLAMIPAA